MVCVDRYVPVVVLVTYCNVPSACGQLTHGAYREMMVTRNSLLPFMCTPVIVREASRGLYFFRVVRKYSATTLCWCALSLLCAQQLLK